MTDEIPTAHRRQFLMTTGAALGTAALAGCMGDSDSSTDGFVFRTLDDVHTLKGERNVILAENAQGNLGFEPRQQIRLGKGRMTLDGELVETEDDGEEQEEEEVRPQNPSIFTLRETRPVEINYSDVVVSQEGLDIIGVEEGEQASFVDYAPNPDISTRDSAQRNNEYIEQIIEGDDTVCFIAPHGGQVYPYTEQQANRAASSMGESAWVTLAFEDDEKTLYDRWYVPPSNIHPESYPKLEELGDRFDYVVSFSGFDSPPPQTTGEGVAVGGLLDEKRLGVIRDAINDVLDEEGGGGVTVWRYPTGSPENPPSKHVANWMTSSNRNGIEITTTENARARHWADIADGVKRGLNELFDD